MVNVGHLYNVLENIRFKYGFDKIKEWSIFVEQCDERLGEEYAVRSCYFNLYKEANNFRRNKRTNSK